MTARRGMKKIIKIKYKWSEKNCPKHPLWSLGITVVAPRTETLVKRKYSFVHYQEFFGFIEEFSFFKN